MYDMPFLNNATKLQQQQGTTDSVIILNRVLVEYVTYKTEETKNVLTPPKNVHVHEYEMELRVLLRLYNWCAGENLAIQQYKPIITLSYMETHKKLLTEQSYAKLFSTD